MNCDFIVIYDRTFKPPLPLSTYTEVGRGGSH